MTNGSPVIFNHKVTKFEKSMRNKKGMVISNSPILSVRNKDILQQSPKNNLKIETHALPSPLPILSKRSGGTRLPMKIPTCKIFRKQEDESTDSEDNYYMRYTEHHMKPRLQNLRHIQTNKIEKHFKSNEIQVISDIQPEHAVRQCKHYTL